MSEPRFFLRYNADGTADWDFWRSGERPSNVRDWFHHLDQVRDAVRAHNAALRTRNELAAREARAEQEELFQ